MTVVVSDLVARFRADTSDVQRGAQVTQEAIRGVTTEAQTASRALEIMAGQFAQLKGGTAAQALEMFQRAGVQPTQAALSQAAAEMQKTAAAATQAVQPSQALARAASEHATATATGAKAAQDVATGWKFSESSAVRFGAALVGVNLGISLVAGAARQIHEAFIGAADAALRLQIAGRAAAANYGPGAAAGISAGAAAFTADPSTRGSAAEYTESVAGMRSLTTEYGLSLGQVQQLVTASGQLARVQGIELPTAAKALDAVMHGNVAAAESLGISLTDTAGRIRGVDASYEELVAISGKTRAEQVLFAATMTGVKTQVQNAIGTTDALASAMDRVTKATNTARDALGLVVSGPAVAGLNQVANFLALVSGHGLDLGQTPAAQSRGDQLRSAFKVDPSTMAGAPALQADAQPAASLTTTYEKLRIAIDRTVESLGRITQEQGQYAAILSAARGPMFPQVLGSPGTIGALTAAQDELGLRAQRVAQGQGDAMHAQLQQAVTTAGDIGPNATARAQQELDQYEQRVAARTQQAAAQHDMAIADLNIAQTQAGLSDITLRQRDRELEMQRQTIGLRQEDVRLQQVSLAAGQQVTQARIAALPTQNAVSAISYQSSLAAALAQQRTGRLMRGQDVSDLPSFDELIGMNTDAAFAMAEAGPGALRAQRGIDIAQQKQTSAQLAQQLNAGVLQGSQLEVDLANLGDLPDQTGLLIQMNQNQRDQLLAQQQERDAVLTLVGIASEPPAAGASAPNLTINFNGAVVRSDQDLDAIANQVFSLFSDALRASDVSVGAPADRSLAGARR